MNFVINTKFEILTSDGWKDFKGIRRSVSSDRIRLCFSDDTDIVCTKDHLFMSSGMWIPADEFVVGQKISDKMIISIDDIEGSDFVYDPVDVDSVHSYLTNNINSHNCILLDEFAHLGPNLADEFMSSAFPTISSSETSKLIIISTPKGMNHYYKLWKEAESGLNGFIPIEATWRDHPTRTQAWADDQLKQLGELKYNQEVEGHFLGSSATLISGAKIGSLPFIRGKAIFDGYTEYFEPEPKHSYIMTVDVARGAELDYSVFPVIDVTSLPYKIVAVFRNNKIDPQMYPEVIHRIAMRYNEAFVLIETNDIGQQVADILFYDIEYENVYMSFRDKINEGSGKKSPGLRTTKKTKQLGCSQLKTLIENDAIEVNDATIIDELSTFVRVGTSYKAEEGKTDDLAMTLVMFAYLTLQPIFKELFDYNLRTVYLQNQKKEWDDWMEPIGFVDRGEVYQQPTYDKPYIEATESWADFPML